MNKKFKLTEIINEDRPMSWSSMSSFDYNPEQWYDKYYLKREQLPTAEMLFGSKIGNLIATDPTFLPELPRYQLFEHKIRATFDGIPLIGFIDGLSPKLKRLGEYKTGKAAWTQKRADTHGQIDFYLLGLHLMHKERPEQFDCFLHWMPTEQNGDYSIQFRKPFQIQTFPTKRTMLDVLRFGARITDTYKKMEEYVRNHE